MGHYKELNPGSFNSENLGKAEKLLKIIKTVSLQLQYISHIKAISSLYKVLTPISCTLICYSPLNYYYAFMVLLPVYIGACARPDIECVLYACMSR